MYYSIFNLYKVGATILPIPGVIQVTPAGVTLVVVGEPTLIFYNYYVSIHINLHKVSAKLNVCKKVLPNVYWKVVVLYSLYSLV